MQLGFVIDHSKCIGCHACTVACKSENDVPVGSFRTWVKYTERGEFPEVRRSFAVLRCNQCTSAPCVNICPTGALAKREDGIVDVDPAACVGCKSCMQACPYDALYINDGTGTAEKCHFCAHRTERGLAPACAVVCPTEAIIPGDFDDANSRVSFMKARDELVERKPEAGTGPNVFYKEVDDAAVEPLKTSAAGGYLWADRDPEAQRLDLEVLRVSAAEMEARTTYDVDHPPMWGWRISGYLFTKSLAAGIFLAGAFLSTPLVQFVLAASLVCLALTGALLVLDLKRPERFLYILKRPNHDSWLVKGTYFLMAFGALLLFNIFAVGWVTLEGWTVYPMVLLTAAPALLCAAYTAWLFRQARGRPLWMQKGLALHLVVQAFVAGAAFLLFVWPLPAAGLAEGDRGTLRFLLFLAIAAHLAMTLLAGRLAPTWREPEYERAHRLITRGPFSRRHWVLGVGVGCIVPLVCIALPGPAALHSLAGACAMIGLLVEEDTFVRAGQALPIS